MQNPWFKFADAKLDELADLAKTPVANLNYDFVLPADRLSCSDFDRVYIRPLCLQTYMPPVPYVGNPEDADVIILAANPGFVERKNVEYENNELFVSQSLKSLRFESDYPIHYLDERFSGYAGFGWWKQVIGDVTNKAVAARGDNFSDRRQIVKRIAGVEWLPYHSNSFDKSPKNEMFDHILPSQHYTKWLVDQAIQRKAQLIVIWGRPHREMWTRFLGYAFPSDTIFPRPEAVRPKNLISSHFAQADIDRIVQILAK